MKRRKLTYHPLSPSQWDDFEALFGPRGACGGCWCMVWRLPRKQWEQQKGDGNRKAMQGLVKSGAEPGILAYDGDKPIGWCSVAPREDFVGLERSRVLRPIDAQPVWSVSCLFVAKDYRRIGVSIGLLRAAIEHVKENGGKIVEGYPVEPYTDTMPAVFAWTGTLAAFKRAGFTEAARGSLSRPIMRYVIRRGKKS
jgi:GNAT superfamily N-acetyltransferase